MKVVMWIGDGPHERALACKLSNVLSISAIAIESKKVKRKLTLSKLADKALNLLLTPEFDKTWRDLLRSYSNRFTHYPSCAIIRVPDINDPSVSKFSLAHAPDLIVVSGTSLIKKNVIETLVPCRIINLHTGLSPYVKGGPNCTNWCLAKAWFDRIGNSVMWLNAGIDSGDLICTEQTNLESCRNLSEIHEAVMEHAHEIYICVIKALQSDDLKRTPQSEIGGGITLFNHQWNFWQRWKAKRNLASWLDNGKRSIENPRAEIRTVKMERL